MELRNLSTDDAFSAAKKGVIIRHLTVPEIVLQTPESDHEGMPTPLCWCKMRTVLRKTAAALISAGFMLAMAHHPVEILGLACGEAPDHGSDLGHGILLVHLTVGNISSF
jgi:hypothetical protein